jgi:type I restriction enzyme S subunit
MTWQRAAIASIKADTPNALVGGPFGSDLTTRDYVAEGVPVIRGQNLSAGRMFNEDDFVYVSDEKARALRANTAVRGDLIFTQRGTLGQVGLIPRNSRFERYVVSQSQMKLTVDPRRVDARFIYFYFSLPSVVEEIKARVITSGVPNINLGIWKHFEVPVPPIDKQRRIAEIATTYEALIENNQRRIKLLEEAARRLYREWFVALRFPGHERVKVVDGVPQGWERATLGSMSTLNYGKALKESERTPGEVPVYGSSGIVGAHNSPLVNGQGIILGRKGNVGSVFLSDGPFFAIDTVYFITPEQTSYFLFLLLQTLPFMSSDSAVPGLNRSYANSLPTLKPRAELLTIFENAVKPMFAQISTLGRQNAVAKQARDALLPRLMSGALAV